jgi:TonB family protein
LDRRLAMAALALGIVGLFTGGLLGLGSLLGLALAVAALVLRGRSPDRYGGTDLAWAAVAANVFALVSLVPLAALGMALWPVLKAEAEEADRLPEPYSLETIIESPAPPPPPPPPPPRPRVSTAEPREVPAAEAPLSPGPVRVGGTIREPRKLTNVAPVYPEIAKQARVQGIVILEVTISPRGHVTHVRVLRGAPLLDAAAVEAVRQWVYTPTLLNGVPVPVIMTVTVNFRLS